MQPKSSFGPPPPPFNDRAELEPLIVSVEPLQTTSRENGGITTAGALDCSAAAAAAAAAVPARHDERHDGRVMQGTRARASVIFF